MSVSLNTKQIENVAWDLLCELKKVSDSSLEECGDKILPIIEKHFGHDARNNVAQHLFRDHGKCMADHKVVPLSIETTIDPTKGIKTL